MLENMTGYPSIDKPWLKYYDNANETQNKEQTVFSYLYNASKGYQGNVAIRYFNNKITYSKLFEKIEKCANALFTCGVRKGDIVTIQALTMPQVVILFYALGNIGATANLLYVTATPKEINENLKLTNSKIYVTISSIFQKNPEVIEGTNVLKTVLLSIGDEADLITNFVVSISNKVNTKKLSSCIAWNDFLQCGTIQAIKNEDSLLPAAMVYTSGTTGKSKAVVLNHESINALVIQYKKTKIPIVRGEKFMNAIPIFVAYGLVFGIHVPLCLGWTDILCVDPSPINVGRMYAKYLPEYFVQGVAGVTNILKNRKLRKKDLSFIKVLGVGGDAVPDSFVQEVNDWLQCHNASISLVIGYGMTEVAATVVSSTPLVNKFGTVGIPLPDTVVKIVEPETIKEIGYNEVGEICFHAPTMMSGYYLQPEETAQVIRKHEDGFLWVHSGDLGYIDEDGFITIKGRIKRMIGVWHEGVYHKVVPKEIEDEILKFENVVEVCVVGKRIDAATNIMEAFIVVNNQENFEILVNQVKEYFSHNLEKWKCPAEFHYIDKLPRNATGKVDWKSLEQQ